MFENRRDAGRQLAGRLAVYRDAAPVVLALPRGGVPVGAEVAEALGAPLDVVLVRKLGVPFQPELGMGAIGEGGIEVVDASLVRRAGVTREQLAAVEAQERAELARRAASYRGDRHPVPVEGRTVIVVDDGLATGGTARAAIEVVRARGAARVVLAVPIAPTDTVAALQAVADEVVSVETSDHFGALGQWYLDFRPTADAEVVELLDRHRTPDRSSTGGSPG
jgi:putative phosphoribosyl transferase